MRESVVVIGAGLTGLTVAFLLKREGFDVLVLEKAGRVGGAIYTHAENGYIYEEGPNTGVVSNPEVAELFEMLDLDIETANRFAEKRLILKKGKWVSLPSGALSFFKSPLFSMKDKFNILLEPLRKRGINPDESVASLAERRIGKSFVDYAVNPFISGIYAGNPEKLVTKYALPKLYNLEQEYGSFIIGGMKKSREKTSERDKKATKKVFSVKWGFGRLIEALKTEIGDSNICCNVQNIVVGKGTGNNYLVDFTQRDGRQSQIVAQKVVSTVGAHALNGMFPFISPNDIQTLSDTVYARIVQVAAALKKDTLDSRYISFGGLIPQKEKRNILGVLFPSYCFQERAPQGCSMLAVYLGGVSRPELFDLADEEITEMVAKELGELYLINAGSIEFMRVFRHLHAIPQYEKSTKERIDTINEIERENPGLILAGNMRNGIGIADRILQAFEIVKQLA